MGHSSAQCRSGKIASSAGMLGDARHATGALAGGANYYPRMTKETNIVSLGLVQMQCTPDPEHNMKTAIQGIRKAAERGAQIVCLPELFRSQYF